MHSNNDLTTNWALLLANADICLYHQCTTQCQDHTTVWLTIDNDWRIQVQAEAPKQDSMILKWMVPRHKHTILPKEQEKQNEKAH